jgi:uncharacterized RDD family membrane protein YckC
MTFGLYLTFALFFIFIDAVASTISRSNFNLTVGVVLAVLWPIMIPLLVFGVYVASKERQLQQRRPRGKS